MTKALVRFDDRLQTVLRQPASDPRDAAVRWRQLVDLIARAGPAVDSHILAEALAVVRADTPRIDEPLRAAAARTIAALPLPLGLLECFIADRLTVSAPILAAASLDPAQWYVVLSHADAETRRFVETLHPELAAMTPADSSEEPAAQPAAPGQTTIGEVVARIERRRRRPPAWQDKGQEAGLGIGGELGVLRWECGPSGEIGWVEGAPRGVMIGRSIVRGRDDSGDRIDEAAVRAFNQRAPFRDAELVLAGDSAVSGTWKISGVPAFDSAEGRFAGYRGIALREFAHQQSSGSSQLPLDGDSLRELVHEIKTPLNAIIGFAEIIDGQYFGPAGSRYRDRATGIVAQARLLLTAIDDLDFAARIQSGAAPASGTADLAAIVTSAVRSLRETAERGGIELIHAAPEQAVGAAVDGRSAERLVERTLTAAVELAERGERLRVAVASAAGKANMTITRPRALAGSSGRIVTGGAPGEDETGLFSLRLARGLARIAGGTVTLGHDEIILDFPAA